MAGSRRGKDGRGEHSRLCVGPDSAAGDPGPRSADLEAGKSAQPSGSSSSRDASDSFLGRLVRIVSGSLGEKDAAAGDERASASKEAGGKAEETGQDKVCLICLESVTQEQLESGEAVYLRCDCKGDVALRHTACAIKWAAVKQSRECDICKAEIQNLPALEDLRPLTLRSRSPRRTTSTSRRRIRCLPPSTSPSTSCASLGSPPSSASCSPSLNWTSPCGSAASVAFATC